MKKCKNIIFKFLIIFFFRLKSEAKAALNKQDKKGALNIMRRVALLRKDIQDKDIQYQRLQSIFQQLTDSKHKKDMFDVLKTCSVTVKETLNRQGLTPEKVDFLFYFIFC